MKINEKEADNGPLKNMHDLQYTRLLVLAIYYHKRINLSDFDFWMKSGRDEVNLALDRIRNIVGKSASTADANFDFLASAKRPKNLVLFVGDGLGLATVTASRIYKGQSRFGSAGEEENLVWETFPDVALLKVRSKSHNGVGGRGVVEGAA